MNAPLPSSAFAVRLSAAAAQARRRIAVRTWLSMVQQQVPWLFAVVVGGALARLCGAGLPSWSVVLVPLWLVVLLLVAWRRVPTTPGALALIDRTLVLDDLLLNAWDFTVQPSANAFASEHLRRAEERLPQVVVAEAVPLTLPVRESVAVVLLALVLASGVLAPPQPAPPTTLDDQQRRDLATQAADLAREAAQVPTAALEQAEKAKLEELQQKIRDAQEQAKRQGLTQPEVLKELDRLAHKAEDLAALLDQADTPNAALLGELERHADTADLAAALRAGDLAKAAQEAQNLAERLGRKDLTLDERRRLEQALERAAKAAAGDRSSAGNAVSQAQAALQKGDAHQAANALKSLAQNLARRQQRQAAAKQMSQLASRLRSTGSKLLSSPAGALTALPSGSRSSGAPLASGPLPQARFQPGARPGTGKPNAMGNHPGNGRPGSSGGAGAGSIPVPGTSPAGGAGAGAGSIPVPGASGAAGAGAVAGNTPGGSQAGVGHVKSSGPATTARTPSNTSTVVAETGNGQSEQVQVAGQLHDEGSARAVSQTPLSVVDAEERALDEDPLPAGRRAQVKEYFHLLREKLEP
jgi:hypothetical protein